MFEHQIPVEAINPPKRSKFEIIKKWGKRLLVLGIIIGAGLAIKSYSPTRPDTSAASESKAPALDPIKTVTYSSDFKLRDSVQSTTEFGLSSKATIIADAKTGEVYYGQDIHKPLAPASIAKLMTAIVAVDQYGMDKVLTVPQAAVDTEGNRIVMRAGEQMSVEQLLHGMLMVSANDVAEVFAQDFPGGRERFVEAMNLKAKQIGLSNTTFKNPSGLDDDGFVVTAKDMATLARLIYTNYPQILPIMAKTEYIIPQTDRNEYHYIYAISDLPYIKEMNILGTKNGKTEAAKTTEVVIARRGSRDVILILLGSKTPLPDVRNALAWCDSNCR